jgi:hypothetical protein
MAPGDEDCNGIAETCNPGGAVWSKKFGDPNQGNPSGGEGLGIASDTAGNVLVCGTATGTIDFGGGPLPATSDADIVIAKLDPQGSHLWSRRFGAQGSGACRDVDVAADGSVWLTGDFFGTMDFGGGAVNGSPGAAAVFAAKLDALGNHQYAASYGTGTSVAIEVDGTGAVVLAGSFSGTLDFGGGALVSNGGGNATDVFVAKLNAQGGHVWSERYGDSLVQGAQGLAVDSSANVIAVGHYDGAPDFGGGPLPFTGSGAFTVKLDPNGNHLWSLAFGGGSSTVSPIDTAADGAGNVWLAGAVGGSVDFGGGPLPFAGGNDLFVAKLSPNGGHLWSQSYGDSGSQVANGVATDAAGNVLLAVELFQGTLDLGGGAHIAAGSHDVVLAKLGNAGAYAFSVRAGDSMSQVPWAVAADPTGHLLATGRFFGTLDFGAGAITAFGNGVDMFAVKLQP